MTTKLEDAKSIVEDEAVLESLNLKSLADDVLVIKSEDNDEDEKVVDGKKKKKGDMAEEECSTVEPVAEKAVENTVVSEVIPATPVTEPTPVEKSLAILVERVNAVKSQGLTGADALQAIQGDFEKVGETLKAEFTPPPSPEDVAKQNLETTLRSILSEMLPAALAQTVAPMQSKLDTLESELRAKSLADTTPIRKEQVETVQRSLPASAVQRAAVEKITKDTFQLLAERTVGGIQ